MDLVTIFYLVFIFISLYISFLFLLIFFKNKKSMYKDGVTKSFPSLTVLVPAYNKEKEIGITLKSIINNNYPKNKIEIIAINDGSTDNTEKIIKQFKQVRLISKENSGKADSLNQTLKLAKGELIVIIDADSRLEKNALKKIVEKFDDPEVGAATSCILVGNQTNLLTKLQAIEYALIAWVRKLFEFVDSVYVTPGPLSVYRKEVLEEVGGFDKENLTEDIELSWNILKHKHKIKTCLSSRVYTIVPTKFRDWWRQRLRWDIGGLQTTFKYSHVILRKKYGMLGKFVSPFFAGSFILSLVGFVIFSFVIIRRIITSFLGAKYTFASHLPILNVPELYFTPGMFTFFGFFLFISLLTYTLCALLMIKEHKIKIKSAPNVLIYLIFYLILYPILLLHSIFIFLTSDNLKW